MCAKTAKSWRLGADGSEQALGGLSKHIPAAVSRNTTTPGTRSYNEWHRNEGERKHDDAGPSDPAPPDRNRPPGAQDGRVGPAAPADEQRDDRPYPPARREGPQDQQTHQCQPPEQRLPPAKHCIQHVAAVELAQREEIEAGDERAHP